MLIIREEQLSAMRDYQWRHFKQHLLQRVLAARGLAADSPEVDNVQARIDREITFARGFGFATEHDIARYVLTVCVQHHADGPLPKQALRILTMRGETTSEKLDRLAAMFVPQEELMQG